MQVRKRKYPSGKIKWVLDKGRTIIDGKPKRVVEVYDTREEAVGKLSDAKTKRRVEGEAGLFLSDRDRALFAHARDTLAAAGATITEALAFFFQHHKAAGEAITLRALLDKCEKEKERLGKSTRYLQQLRCSCLSFIRGREDVPAHAVTPQQIKDWLAGNQWAPKTQSVYLGDLRTLFAFAVAEGHTTRNPCAGTGSSRIQIAEPEETAIQTLYVEQCRRLLHLAAGVPKATMPDPDTPQLTMPAGNPPSATKLEEDFRPLLPYVVLGMFCGIRPAELTRLAEAAVSVAEAHVIVAATIAKTRRRRVVDIAPAALAWLKLVSPLPPGPLVPRNFRRRWARLRMAAGWRPELQALAATDPRPDPSLPEWPHDVLRHTFASMHYAHHQNESLLKAQLGHSQREEVLFQHYRAIKTRAEAAAFWELFPEK